ncbi:MAG TPA: cyanase [Achromobacter sp.]|nr:cyanase [Achromobacter sp.]
MKMRAALIEKILIKKLETNIKWQAIADALGLPLAKATAACLGQMPLSELNVGKLDDLLSLGLTNTEKLILQTSPDRGSLEALIPTDPAVYRFYEFLLIYGSTLKQLISEKFGDGVMSTTDFDLVVDQTEGPSGPRVRLQMTGKFMPFTMN